MTAAHSLNTLSVNGIDLYYEIYSEGKPLLLLHGFTGSGADLSIIFKQLSKTHRLIIPDLRGHGRSTNPSKKFTFRQAALDVIALLEYLNITGCDAVGLSGGGCTLLHIALLQPDRIKAMALISAAPYYPQQLGILCGNLLSLIERKMIGSKCVRFIIMEINKSSCFGSKQAHLVRVMMI